MLAEEVPLLAEELIRKANSRIPEIITAPDARPWPAAPAPPAPKVGRAQRQFSTALTL